MLLLVDYSSLLYRAWHSTPPSVPMNGVHGCLNMLARIIGDRHPDRLALAVDEDWRPQFRVDAIPRYKAHRLSDEPDPVSPQEQHGRRVFEAIGLAVIGSAGFEAEDVIATLVEHTQDDVEILSGDRDLFTLVADPRVRVLYPLKGVSDLALVDEAYIAGRYGIPGRAYGDFALLRGDPSDGLPGIEGIGEKTAASLVRRYGSLDAILAASDLAPAIARRLGAGREYLEAARRVVPPVADVPLPARLPLELPSHVAAPDTLRDLTEPYRLGGSVDRLLRALGVMP